MLLSLSEGKACTSSFTTDNLIESGGLRFGREPGSAVVLDDPRISTHHFTIRVCSRQAQMTGETPPTACLADADTWAIELVDESSNGTWVNNRLVGKGSSVRLHAGDCIFALPSAHVGQRDMIGFAVALSGRFATPPLKVATPLRAQATARMEQRRNRSAKELDDDMAQTMHCKLCDEGPIHRVVTTVPCGHNFCLGCFLVWRQCSVECPSCDQLVRQIVRNHNVDSIIETYLQAKPDATRPAPTTDILNSIENDRKHAVLLAELLEGVQGPLRRPVRSPPELPLTHLRPPTSSNGRASSSPGSSVCTIC